MKILEKIEIIFVDYTVQLLCKCGEIVIVSDGEGRHPCSNCGRSYQVNAFVVGYEDEDNT